MKITLTTTNNELSFSKYSSFPNSHFISLQIYLKYLYNCLLSSKHPSTNFIHVFL